MSKLQSDTLREVISQVVNNAKEKKRNFTETIELQIGLKNYDPQKDKRFSGSVKLPHIPRPKMKICMLGDAQHVEEVLSFFSNPISIHFYFCVYIVIVGQT
nr:60s ribosomal protein l10a [Quercus suber]